MMILDSKSVEYEIIDITEPGKELEKEFMQANSNARNNKYPLPPQIFNEDDYCGVIIFFYIVDISIILNRYQAKYMQQALERYHFLKMIQQQLNFAGL